MTSRLKELRVYGLFGLYNHVIPFHLDDRITAIIGPNGFGKTACLKIIEAFFRRNYSYWLNIPFDRILFEFTGGEEVEISSDSTGEDQPARAESTGAWGRPKKSVSFRISVPSHAPMVWRPAALTASSRPFRELSRVLPHMRNVGPDEWIDRRDGEEITTADLIARYGRTIPPKLLDALKGDEPEMLRHLLSGIECHLIETQRLLVLPGSTAGQAIEEEEFDWSGPARKSSSPLAVQQKASQLSQIIKNTLTEYAALSQSLDRSFPRRVLESPLKGASRVPDTELRKELERLDERRKALMAAGILDTDFEPVTISFGSIDPGVARVLQIYVTDTDKKLTVFDRLRERLDVLKDLINRRFSDKSLRVNKERGFEIVSTTGREVPLDKLSSGEQHQLILTFELLFEVQKDSLILIDEPELSLHVTWQKSFIDSLKRMIQLNGFDVVLATHSPPLVARHYGLTVELGPVDEQDQLV